MVPFAANTTAKTANGFEWAGQPPIIAPSRGKSRSHLKHGSLSQPPNGMMISTDLVVSAYTAAKLTMLLNEADNPKIVLSLWGSGLPSSVDGHKMAMTKGYKEPRIIMSIATFLDFSLIQLT